MEIPVELRYTTDHEWLRLEDDIGVVGVTDFAQDEMGDVVFVELPEVGRVLTKGETFGVVESVKAVSDLFAPVSGEVVSRNEALFDAPEQVNAAPYGDGWMIRIRVSDPAELDDVLDAAAYQSLIEEA